MNVELIKQGANKVAVERISCIVDMAKAEALDAMGEHQAATELVERHLSWCWVFIDFNLR